MSQQPQFYSIDFDEEDEPAYGPDAPEHWQMRLHKLNVLIRDKGHSALTMKSGCRYDVTREVEASGSFNYGLAMVDAKTREVVDRKPLIISHASNSMGPEEVVEQCEEMFEAMPPRRMW